ncbi:hypothetical protein R6G73_07515 [Actinotignum sanguinis]|uniref:hypothetical protein n=1 Tax=Actinotignum sanguinis TaxID=1445614 RepID=UPI0026B14A57|nr:hypothetical protein [Actinotignum sanguinis]MDY5148728.1 hypothetical protein [Actinotignum sanguinis]
MSTATSSRSIPRVIGIWALRIGLAAIFGLPLLFMVVSSFKPDTQIFGDMGGLQAFSRSVTSASITIPGYSIGSRSGASSSIPSLSRYASWFSASS